MALGNGIPPELAQLLQLPLATQSTDPRAALLEAIQNAMGQRLKTPGPDTQMASLPQGLREDDPRRIYLGAQNDTNMESFGDPNYTPPVPEYRDFNPDRSPGVDDVYMERMMKRGRGSLPRKGEDKAAAMAERAVEGKGVTYPKTQGDESDANNSMAEFPAYKDLPSSGNIDPAEKAVADKLAQGGRESQAERHSSRFTQEGDSYAYETAVAATKPGDYTSVEDHPDPENWEDNRKAFIKKQGMTPEEWLNDY